MYVLQVPIPAIVDMSFKYDSIISTVKSSGAVALFRLFYTVCVCFVYVCLCVCVCVCVCARARVRGFGRVYGY